MDQIPAVTVLALAAQVADKICAMFERRGADGMYSSRARDLVDLVDLAMISAQEALVSDEVIEHLRREEARRRDAGTLVEPLPTALRLADEQVDEWSRRWAKATRQAPVGFDEAYASAARFVDPVLTGGASGATWSPAGRTWRPVGR